VASNHMINNVKSLTYMYKCSCNLNILTINGNFVPITTTSDVSLSLTDVFVSLNLDCKVEFSKSSCVVQDQQSRKMIVKGAKMECLFPLHLPLSPSFSLPYVTSNCVHVDFWTWHKHLRHPNSNVLHNLFDSGLLGNTKSLSLNVVQFECNSCRLGKSKTLSFSTHTLKVVYP
jgi:hypothetical protein